MNQSIASQIPKNLLFHYRFPCVETEIDWSDDFELPPRYRVPCFSILENNAHFGDLRIGWRPEGLLVWAKVTGKKQSTWCRQTQMLESDGLQLWIDTRDTQNIHRASKFCHWFVLTPGGEGAKHEKPVASMLKINRSKDHSPTINRQKVKIASRFDKTGYELRAMIPGATLNGWDTDEHRNLGFYYALVDRELGWQTLAAGPELPIAEDPSLWCTMQLR